MYRSLCFGGEPRDILTHGGDIREGGIQRALLGVLSCSNGGALRAYPAQLLLCRSALVPQGIQLVLARRFRRDRCRVRMAQGAAYGTRLVIVECGGKDSGLRREESLI